MVVPHFGPELSVSRLDGVSNNPHTKQRKKARSRRRGRREDQRVLDGLLAGRAECVLCSCGGWGVECFRKRRYCICRMGSNILEV